MKNLFHTMYVEVYASIKPLSPLLLCCPDSTFTSNRVNHAMLPLHSKAAQSLFSLLNNVNNFVKILTPLPLSTILFIDVDDKNLELRRVEVKIRKDSQIPYWDIGESEARKRSKLYSVLTCFLGEASYLILFHFIIGLEALR